MKRDNSVVDNEGLGRKSSKRCCIFHKQRAFGESSTESSDDSDFSDAESSSSSVASSSSSRNTNKIARKKKGIGKKVKDHQRYHA